MVNGQTTSFSYDAAGIRVKTVKPNGTIVDTPFPGYEVENPTGTAIIRRTYFIAGQTIATRVTGHSAGANNGLFFFYTDHLGSTSMLHKSGQSVPFTGSTTRYYPFGGYRGPAPSQAITDRDFTGQRENMELGLLYYNARYYLPGIARFVSADTLVPNPTNPQNWNRYSYTNNNPIRFTDPTGHCAAEGAGGGGQCAAYSSFKQALLDARNFYQDNFSLPFEGTQNRTQDFSPTHDGVDWSGDFTVRSPASGTVTRASSDSPAGIWRIREILRDADGNQIGTGQTREWSVFDTATESPLYSYNRGDDGLLEPERLLATGNWEDLAPGWSHISGTVVKIDHGHNLETIYYHTNYSVEAGATVDQGDMLGTTANNGWSSGTHLHYTLQFTYGDFSIKLNPLNSPMPAPINGGSRVPIE